ncbi:MAG: alpha/beta hydrolase [Culicoidibacterales bacterium]
MKKSHKIIIAIGLSLILLFSGGLIFASNYFYNLSIARTDKSFLASEEEQPKLIVENDVYLDEKQQNAQWLAQAALIPKEITAFDGIKLKGTYIPGPQKTNKTMIIVHGYDGYGLSMTTYARFYQQKYGTNIFMADARGHGKSEGEFIGMGWADRLDYLKWIDLLISDIGPSIEIGFHGVSMGGATVMMLSGEELPKQVKFLIEDCGYTDVYAIFKHKLKQMYNLPPFPLLDTTSIVTEIKAGYGFKEASSIDALKRGTTPILMVHGDADTFVPFWMLDELYNASNSQDKQKVVIEGAEHGDSFEMNNEQKYTKAIDRYVTKYFTP